MTVRYAPHARAVRVRHLATGEIAEVSPVDARERVSHVAGGWEYVPESAAEPMDASVAAALADTPRTSQAALPATDARPIVERLGEKSYADLKALGRTVGIAGNLPKEALITALVPHIHGGTISLDEVKGLPPTLSVLQFPSATPAG